MCFKQAQALNMIAWNNSMRPPSKVVGSLELGNGKMDSWGYSYLTVRGEILGFVKDGLLRKHLPRMFSLINNES